MNASLKTPASRPRRAVPSTSELRQAAARIRRGWSQAERVSRRRLARLQQLRLLELAICAAA